MPLQYSAEFRRRAVALVDEGRPASTVAVDLGVAQATMFRWLRQARVDRGEIPGESSAEATQLKAALRRIRELEQELHATRLAAKELRDPTIRPKGGSRW